jgi:hypothetical protein
MLKTKKTKKYVHDSGKNILADDKDEMKIIFIFIFIKPFQNTVKPVLTTTSEQQPPANNNQP